MSAFAPQRLECRADRGAHEPPAALGWRKIIAEAFLNGPDSLTERGNSFLGQSGKELHQNQATDMVRLRLVEKREGRESRPLAIAMDATCRSILKQEDAPVRRKRQPRDDRRLDGAGAPAAVDYESSLMEGGDADARPLATREREYVLAPIAAQPFKAAERRRKRERERGPRA